ncbi:D-aminoacyl-tRNA deacylase [Halobacteriaceae archaeon GCM10025711]
MIGVVVSRADSASEHVGEHLLDLVDWTTATDDERPDGEGGGTVYRRPGFELREFDDRHLDLAGVAAVFDDPELVVFASRHAGETGPLLTAHFTGNFGSADLGGDPNTLPRAAPNAQKQVLAALEAHAPDGYETGLEGTHHGPTTVGAPSLFVEVGSDEEQWADPDGARAVARAILDLEGVAPDGDRHLVGFGSGHYVPRPTRIVRETDWAFGHVATDWALAELGDPADHRDVLDQAFRQSAAEYAVVVDDHPDLVAVVEDLGYRVVGETWVRETDGVPLSLVEVLEGDLSTVDDGLRFGRPARGYRGEYVVSSLPDDLLEEAHGIDADAMLAAVAETALAFETHEAGNRVGGMAAFPDPTARDDLVDRLVAVLAEKYDAVERHAGQVVAHETAFDPEKAATLGIPEGPAFGKLARGEAVTVRGETIDPETVSTERTLTFEG